MPVFRKRENKSINRQPSKKSPQKGFPLLQLPLLAQIEVLKHMKPTELMLFSLLSERAKLVAMASNRKIGNLTWDFAGNANFSFYMYPVNDEITPVRIQCTGAPSKELLEDSHRETISLNGFHLSLAFYRGIWYVLAGSPRDVMSISEVLTKHLLDVFKFCEFEFHGCNLTIDPKDVFVWKYAKTFAYVDFWGTITDNLVRFALGNSTMKQFLMTSKTDGSLRYSGSLHVENLNTAGWDGLTPDALFNMDCKRVFCTGPVDIDMNSLPKHWHLGKGLHNLEEILINKLSNPDCLEGIETFPSNVDNWPEKQQWRYSRHPYMDIRRNDGMGASVISDCFFHFFRHCPS